MPESTADRAPVAARRRYAFRGFVLDVERGALRHADTDVKLRPKSFEVLRYLIERHGRLVTKQELLDAVWGRAVVTEGSLTQCLIEVRRAIGDDAQRLIRTIPRRGLIFDVPVTAAGDGAVSDGEATKADLPKPAVSLLRPLGWLVIAILAAIALLTALWWVVTDRGSDVAMSGQSTGAESAPVSIAVLPFVDMSSEQDQEYFADGLSEELLNLLAQIPALTVIARTSSFSFKGQNVDVATIAGKLGVSHVLEGSVRKSGDRVRITAQLVDAGNSAHVWSDTYDRTLKDVFTVQDEIAGAVAAALKRRLVADERKGVGTGMDPAAHERFLQAQYFYNRRAPGDVERARDYYQQAVDIDPDYALAWVGLAAAYNILLGDGAIPVEEWTVRSGQAVERALALAPDNAEARVRAARHYEIIGERPTARKHWQTAQTLAPDSPLVLGVRAGQAAWEGRIDEAIELQRRVVALDPVASVVHSNLAVWLLAAAQLSEARKELQIALELSPGSRAEIERELVWILILEQEFEQALEHIETWPAGVDRDLGLALAYHGLGRESEAEAALSRLIAVPGLETAIRAAEVYARRGELDEAFRWLAKARDEFGPRPLQTSEWSSVDRLWVSPFLGALRADPRWADLRAWLKRLN